MYFMSLWLPIVLHVPLAGLVEVVPYLHSVLWLTVASQSLHVQDAPQGDYAIDLLRQMPGVEVRNRQIIVSGKQVRRTYINGALIFGLDPMAGMENLVGEQVTQFYVYDEDNPQDRLDGQKREKERVINIHTKDPIFSVTDLQFRAIAGADQERREDGSPLWRYSAGVNGKYFSELRQLRTDVVTGNLGMTSSQLGNVPQVQSQYHVNSAAHLGYDRFWQSPLYGNGMQMSYDYGRDRTKGRRRALTAPPKGKRKRSNLLYVSGNSA